MICLQMKLLKIKKSLLLKNILTDIGYLFTTYLKGKPVRDNSMSKKNMKFNAVNKFIYIEQRLSWEKLYCLKSIINCLFTVKISKYGSKLISVFSDLTFGLLKSVALTVGVNNTQKYEKGLPKIVINHFIGTRGLPKGNNAYGNGVIIVPAYKSRYIHCNEWKRGRITRFNFFSIKYYCTKCESNEIDIELKRLFELAKLYKKKQLNVNLYKFMYKKELYYKAYNKLKSKPGNMTPGLFPDTLDGISNEWIDNIIESMKDQSFQFSPLRRVYINKPKGGKRPLTIGSPRDKLIQEVMRIILESIFEPTFDQNSFGFRPKRGCHSALANIDKNFQDIKWIIEFDIIGFFDNIDKVRLFIILKQRIKDPKFINLLYKLWNAGYGYSKEPSKNTITGIPQGSVISPLLSNIYLNVLDQYLNDLAYKINIGNRPRVSKTYNNLRAKLNWQIKKGNEKEAKAIRKILLETPYYVDDESYKRLKYIRYADDFLVGLRTSYKQAREVAESIKTFMKIELGLEITFDIKDFTKQPVQFLGVLIKNGKIVLKYIYKNNRKLKQRIKTRIQFYAPINNIINKLIDRGFMNKQHEGIPKSIWMPLDIREIIYLYNAIIRGYYNYYFMVNNMGNLVSLLWHRMRESCAKLLAMKLKLKTQKSVFEKFGPNLEYKGFKLFKPSYKVNKYKRFKINLLDEIQVINSLYATHKSIARLFNLPCMNCGSTYKVEMHHIRKMQDIKNKKDTFSILMSRAKRKQIPLCRVCHNKVHSNN